MEHPKISIIIPVYNTAEFVSDAIASVLHQTIREIEIIVIDDGSTDNSLEIINRLTDERIQVYTQRNQGQATARNTGLQAAKGRYIYFMDSDDLLEKEALSDCYELCEKDQLDFVFFDAETFGNPEFKSPFSSYSRRGLFDKRTYSGKEVLDLLLKNEMYRSPVWLYLVRRDFLEEKELRFYPVRHEDDLFTGLLHIHALRVKYRPNVYFKRRLRSHSVMTSSYSFTDISSYFFIVSQFLEHAGTERNREITAITNKLVKRTLNGAVYNARVLSLKERMIVFRTCLLKGFVRFLSLKSLTILLFPAIIRLKSVIQKKEVHHVRS